MVIICLAVYFVFLAVYFVPGMNDSLFNTAGGLHFHRIPYSPRGASSVSLAEASLRTPVTFRLKAYSGLSTPGIGSFE
jgi:hypothetical protein